MKHFGEVFFVAVMVWVFWIFFSPTPHQRLYRACAPVDWTIGSFTALARATNSDYANEISLANKTIDYKCELTLWEYFYRRQFLKAHPGVTKTSADQYEYRYLQFLHQHPNYHRPAHSE